MQITTIGLDLAKNVFQVHGVDEFGKVIVTRQLRRGQLIAFFKKLPPCLVGMEACATAHHWARELRALGHEVRLMPASYVKAYVKPPEERCGRCGGHLRGGDAAEHAVRAGEDGRAAGGADAAPHARSARSASVRS